MSRGIWCLILSPLISMFDTDRRVTLCLVLVLVQPGIIFAHSDAQESSADFSEYSVIHPRISHARTKREITSTKENDFSHVELLTVAFTVNGVERILDLRLNTDLIPVGYQHRHQEKGRLKTYKPTKEEISLCHYQGSVRDAPGSWVALSTCNGLNGVIYDGEDLHYIHSQRDSIDAPHFLYKNEHLTARNTTCGYKGHKYFDDNPRPDNRILRYKRDTSSIRGPYDSNRQSRFVELVIVVDKRKYESMGSNLKLVHQYCKDIANIINALYTELNIFIALVGVEVWTETDEITLSVRGDETLNNFIRYRRERLVHGIPNDNAQLLTKIHFEGGVVGKALKGPICTYEFSGGVNVDHSNVIGLVAATIAHEMGHNFGMEHDGNNCHCPDDKCIMTPSSGGMEPKHWSSCSQEHLALAFDHGMDYCLRNKPEKLFESPTCGNGFVETGEECDCGLEEYCNNPCCNATTCMLYANATCATGECCDLKTCTPRTAGTECRSARGECDLPEYCLGDTEYCPPDVFRIDGDSCNSAQAYCYQGSCKTRNEQCRLLWGPSGASSDNTCYLTNMNGSVNGNCGYDRVKKVYKKCERQDVLCGMLHCRHYNEKLEFGSETAAIQGQSFLNIQGQIIACRTAIIDLGLGQMDPGLAPNGVKCDTNKMCVNQACVPATTIRDSLAKSGEVCPNNCSDNGICNSLGRCHCNMGFAPPTCKEFGFGGSTESGPAQDPYARREYVMSLYIIFLGIVPVISLISICIWFRKNERYKWKKGTSSPVNRSNNTPSIKTIDRSSPMPRNVKTIDSTITQDSASASLLPKSESTERLNNNLFGQFKGFSLMPIHDQTKMAEPTGPAPPPPTVSTIKPLPTVSTVPTVAAASAVLMVPTVAIKTNLKPVHRNSILRGPVSSGISTVNQMSIAPALPPLNPGSSARPLISSPVLAATTCTSMELIGPKVPSRPAPEIPGKAAPEIAAITSIKSVSLKPQRPNSSPLTNVILAEVEKKPEKGSALNRIASILRPNSGISRSNSQPPLKDDKRTNSLPRNQHHKANKLIDKEVLRNLEISHPIPQTDIEIPTPVIPVTTDASEEEKKIVMRAQSMRDGKVVPRPAIPTFGSMRQANTKRPTSIPASTRPTSPPPGPPKVTSVEKMTETGMKIPGLPGYQNPPMPKSVGKIGEPVDQNIDNAYDDCLNFMSQSSLENITEESPSSDNIYAVIEESIPEKVRKKTEPQIPMQNEYKSPKPIEKIVSPPATSGSMELLSEIVSEISNRNLDSIYSTSTLARKKKEKEEMDKLNKIDKTSDNSGSNSSLGTYMNSTHYKSPGSIYSTSPSGKFNSASSTTSSGYLNPSALAKPNAPTSAVTSAQTNAKLTSLESSNPNVNDDMSKQLGMKPPDDPAGFKVVESTSNRPMDTGFSKPKKLDKKEEGKAPTKPPLNRTKTPPYLAKGLASKQADTKSAKPAPDTAFKTSRQGSDTSLKSAKPPSSLNKSNSHLNKSNSNLNKSNSNLNKSNTHLNKSTNSLHKQGSSSNLSPTTPKSSPSSPKSSASNFSVSNSPDLVSSCSNTSQNSSKSPDVLSNSPKTVSPKTGSHLKTPTLPRSIKTPSTSPKPANIITKSSSLVDKKKSPVTNVSVVKSLSARESANKAPLASKPTQKTDVKASSDGAKSNTVQKAASSKSNVASLQQRFEINRPAGMARNSREVTKKPIAGKTT